MTRRKIAFPVVLKATGTRSVAIIYWDHAEYYTCESCNPGYHAYKGDKETPFNPYDEMDLCTGNGYRFVHVAYDNSEQIDARVQELETRIEAMKENCPEGGCLVKGAA